MIWQRRRFEGSGVIGVKATSVQSHKAARSHARLVSSDPDLRLIRTKQLRCKMMQGSADNWQPPR